MQLLFISRQLLLIFLSTVPVHHKSGANIISPAQSVIQCETLINKGITQTTNWKLGIALYSFHAVSFQKQLDLVLKTGIKNIEGYTFASAGPEFEDSTISQLSNPSLQKLKALVKSKGLRMTSMYIGAGPSLPEWKRQFEIAQIFGVKYVTTEPPRKLWNSIDSIAGVFKIKVAIHNHWQGMSQFWHPDSVLAAIKGHPNFGACPDLGHWPKSGIKPLDGLRKLKGHLIAIHLKDVAAYNNKKIEDVPIGTGVINFQNIFRELRNQHFKGYINIERDAEEKPDNLSSVIKEIVYYKQLIKALE